LRVGARNSSLVSSSSPSGAQRTKAVTSMTEGHGLTRFKIGASRPGCWEVSAPRSPLSGDEHPPPRHSRSASRRCRNCRGAAFRLHQQHQRVRARASADRSSGLGGRRSAAAATGHLRRDETGR
jgi:hypothetical protein